MEVTKVSAAPALKGTSSGLSRPERSLPMRVDAFIDSLTPDRLPEIQPQELLERFIEGADLFTSITEQNAFSGRPNTPAAAVDDLLESAQAVVAILTDYEASALTVFERPENALYALAKDVLRKVSSDPADSEKFLAEVERWANQRMPEVMHTVHGGRQPELCAHLSEQDIGEALQQAGGHAARWLPAELKRWIQLQTALGTPAGKLAAELDPEELSLSCSRAEKREELYSAIVEKDEGQDHRLLAKLGPVMDILAAKLHEPSVDGWIKANGSAVATAKVAEWEQRALRQRFYAQTAGGRR